MFPNTHTIKKKFKRVLCFITQTSAVHLSGFSTSGQFAATELGTTQMTFPTFTFPQQALAVTSINIQWSILGRHRTPLSLVTRTIHHGTQGRPISEEEKWPTHSWDLPMVFSIGIPPQELR